MRHGIVVKSATKAISVLFNVALFTQGYIVWNIAWFLSSQFDRRNLYFLRYQAVKNAQVTTRNKIDNGHNVYLLAS